jgi:hypothetical protein
MAKTRCSNCEKSVNYREKSGKVYNNRACKATGEKIMGKSFYEVRKCTEFFLEMSIFSNSRVRLIRRWRLLSAASG